MAFPSLYVLASSKEAWVADVWDGPGEGGHWNPCFGRHLNDWKIDVIETFLSRLQERPMKARVVWMNYTNKAMENVGLHELKACTSGI